jgi:two-component system phosphate regulon sensor histidine kinase PhoR
MKRKIGLEFIALIFVSLLIFTVGATLLVKSNNNKITELNLEKYLEIIKIETEDLEANQIIDKYQNLDNYLRITFIDSSGNVVADTLADTLDNHLDRPEIINFGKVYLRYSNTLKIDMMYLADRLDDGSFVRVAIPSTTIAGFLNDFIALSVVIGVVIVILSIFISSYMINQSLLPLNQVKSILKDIKNDKYQKIESLSKYDEINEIVKEINEINKVISDNFSELKYEKQKLDFLLNYMNQGVCVLNQDKKIVLLNSYLKNIYNFNIDYNMNKDYRYLFRDEDVQKVIKEIYTDKINKTLITKINESYYSISIIYSERDWDFKSSVILIYSDVTSIKNIEILKRDFFINASHELKTPLTSIIGSAELITQGLVVDLSSITDLVKRIGLEATRMNNLVMDMLLLSEYETRNENQNKTLVQLKRVVNEVVDNLKVLSEEKSITIETKSIDTNIHINYEDIYQIFKNLIENSIKYGKSKGNIWINIEELSNQIKISVKDDGIGIPKSDLNRVFERFYRVDKARSKMTGGTGLGLSIVKHIVLNNDGNIDLISEEDNGTEVIIYLPKVN